MSRSTPSLLPPLRLVAVAGYQNGDRISEILSDARQESTASGTPLAPAGGFVAEIGQFFQGRSVPTALGDLVDRFKAADQGDAADSWVSDKANLPLGVDALEAALGQETRTELARKTHLSQSEILLRLNVALPDVVNSFTLNGRPPTDGEVRALV